MWVKYLMRLLLLSTMAAFLATNLLAGAQETYTNSFGQLFRQVSEGGTLLAVHETRVKDYAGFVKETQRTWPKAGFTQGPDHPAVNVSWEDAKAYARWLTDKEHAAGSLPAPWSYRLPKDDEWSLAVGLAPGGSMTEEVYPWGTGWPPPPQSGNYSPDLQVDKFAQTSPVGSFAANPQGFFDLGGNVWEWCEDTFNNSPDYRILRGASWRMKGPVDLMSNNRIGNVPSIRLPVYGFRLAIERPAPEVRTPVPDPADPKAGSEKK